MLPGISIHDFMGSAHITAMMRSVIGMSVVQQKGRQFSLNGPRRVEVVKTNLTPTYPPALSVTLEQPAPGAVRFSYAPVETDDTGADEQTPEEWLVKYLEENGPTAFRRPGGRCRAGEYQQDGSAPCSQAPGRTHRGQRQAEEPGQSMDAGRAAGIRRGQRRR